MLTNSAIIKNLINILTNKLQITFRDRISSAEILASGLSKHLGSNKRNVIVLGIPRGGIITADIIARKLKTSNFDIVIPRKLLTPHSEENGFGAIMEDTSTYIDSRIIDNLSLSSTQIKNEITKQLCEIKRRSILYRNPPELLEYHSKINNNDRTVILVDDGADTGSTLISVARWIRNRDEHKFKKLIIAIPVAPKETIKILKNECDYLEVIFQPSGFRTVSQFFKEFLPVTDQQVVNILSKWK